jgi:hypothetical protein
MTTSQMVDLVRRWFEQAKQAYGPVLPDGWFGGRPYENLYLLQNVQELGELLVISLSEETTLTLNRPKRAYIANTELVFEDFDEVTLRWKHYGGTEYRELRYTQGQVRLVPPLGTILE